MEVGIEDCLHIEFEYNKSKYVVMVSDPSLLDGELNAAILPLPANRYHLKDVIVGKIYFLLVRIKIKHMELAIMKRESTGAGRFSLSPSLFSLRLFLFNLLGDVFQHRKPDSFIWSSITFVKVPTSTMKQRR
jgi:hypothetical protein